MAWLIMRITPAESDSAPAGAKPEAAANLRARHSLAKGEVGLLPKAIRLAERHGWEVEIAVGTKRHTQEEWPFTAFTYVSKSKKGHGRSGSSLFRLPCRRKPEPAPPPIHMPHPYDGPCFLCRDGRGGGGGGAAPEQVV